MIYSISNKINHKKYIGQTFNLNARRNQHLSLLRRNIHSNKKLQNSFNKHGEHNFSFNVILTDVSSDEINDIEKFLIKEFDTLKTGYNMDLGGYDKSNLGFKFIYNGKEYRSINKTAKELNIKENTLHNRVKKGYVQDFKFKSHPTLWKSCSWNGVEYRSITHAAKALGISDVTMGDRLRKGYKCDSDLGFWNVGKSITVNGVEYKSISQASEILKISRTTLRKRYMNEN